jgi:hypothetical protein
MGINQGSGSSAGDDVDDDESSSDGGPSSGDDGFLASGEGADEATPMKDDERCWLLRVIAPAKAAASGDSRVVMSPMGKSRPLVARMWSPSRNPPTGPVRI